MSGMSNIKNIYFSDEAYAILEKPIYENGIELKRSTKVNRAIMERLTKVKSQSEVQFESMVHNLTQIKSELLIISAICHPDYSERLDKCAIIMGTILSSITKKE
tara:strand:- start:185 stop:496 length:312 start_codon:yes stop_codon:yes gene_type:complete